MHILVIDDDVSVGTAIQALLSRENCEVTFVQDGALGVQAFGKSRFDAVIVDIFMPRLDGFEIIEVFRQQDPTVPIIAMSGFRYREANGSAPDFLAMAVKLGATCCLAKPFGPRQLMMAVNACRDNAGSTITPPAPDSVRGVPQ